MKKSKRNRNKVSIFLIIGIFVILMGSTFSIIGAQARPTEPIFPTYTGYVRSTSGTALSGALVRLYSGGVQVSTDYTDSNGYYCVGNDYVSSPYLKVEKTGYITQTRSVSSSGGTYNFYLQSNVYPTYTGYVRNRNGVLVANALVRLYSGGVQVCTDYTDSNGYYCVGNDHVSSPYIKVEKDPLVPQTRSVSSSGGTYNFYLGEKIAVFFWATDACKNYTIDKYIDYMDDEGYTKIFEFEDSTNVAGDCQTVDNYEGVYDAVFVYIIGHGLNWWGHSYTCFSPCFLGIGAICSGTFRDYMDNWESTKKGILVESCYSGDWVDDFKASPYLAISTSDETHTSYGWPEYEGGPLKEGIFSYYFFKHIHDGYNAISSYYYAKGYVDPYTYDNVVHYQYPKISDLSSYNWFG